MNIQKIKQHFDNTSFSPNGERGKHHIQLWTCNGEGLFSDGQEGFALAPDQHECNHEDLEFLAKAPEYIKWLLAELTQ